MMYSLKKLTYGKWPNLAKRDEESLHNNIAYINENINQD